MKFNYIHQLVRGLVIAMIVATAAASAAQAQKNLALEANTLTAGEELVFEAEFSRAVLRKVDVADFHFRTRRDTVQNDAGASVTSWRLIGDVTSKGIFSKLFNLRLHEHIESSVDPATFSVLRTSKVDEQGKRVRHSEAIFDRTAGKVTWTERDPNNPRQEPRVMTASFAGTIHDVVSAIYFMRIQPLEVGKGFDIQISDSGRIYQLPVKVVERRQMKTLLGRIGVVRVDADIFGEERLIRGKGKFSIWLSDDARHIPVRADLSSEVGKFEIKLKKASVTP